MPYADITHIQVDQSAEDKQGAISLYIKEGALYRRLEDGTIQSLGEPSGDHPNLAVHDSLGLATQGELDDHEAASDPHTAYQRESEKGVANGYASLDVAGTIPDAQIPASIARDSELPDLAAHVAAGDPHPDYALTSELPDLAGHVAAGDPHTAYQKESEKGAVNGYAGLDGSGLIADALIPSTIARDSELPDLAGHVAAADPHTGYVKENDASWVELTDASETELHSHPAGGGGLTGDQIVDLLYPIGSLYISTLSTNPGTLLSQGTWVAFGAGRVMVGLDSGQTEFDTVEETGGAKTHTLTEGEMPSHTHTQNSHNHTQDAHTHTQNAHSHSQMRFPTATGGSTGFTVDTSMSGTQAAVNATSSDTAVNQNATATNQAATAVNQDAGSDGAHNNLQPYIVVYMWKRTA